MCDVIIKRSCGPGNEFDKRVNKQTNKQRVLTSCEQEQGKTANLVICGFDRIYSFGIENDFVKSSDLMLTNDTKLLRSVADG